MAYHPQTNRQAEFSNRQLKQILEKVVNPTHKHWLFRLDEALWAYQITFKTPLGMSPFKLVYGKPCHFPVELEHKTYWAIKKLNIDWSAVGTNCLLELNEMEEFRAQTYENAKLLKLFPAKLKSRWSGPFEIVHVYSHGAVRVKASKNDSTFKVNGERLKHYFGAPIINDKNSITFQTA
ncbi:uncharacterized protein [Gossypium hirsutum]|uniref:Protein NYNRIN-like n=1 Tax=Gossypium hirsutum TaxID=3635 RepID=A0A1U8IM26_GOSHI|nr:uncharacterized protein LOC107898199 [Gossypium hirsutum]